VGIVEEMLKDHSYPTWGYHCCLYQPFSNYLDNSIPLGMVGAVQGAHSILIITHFSGYEFLSD
jgi:hypothetical protein